MLRRRKNIDDDDNGDDYHHYGETMIMAIMVDVLPAARGHDPAA